MKGVGVGWRILCSLFSFLHTSLSKNQPPWFRCGLGAKCILRGYNIHGEVINTRGYLFPLTVPWSGAVICMGGDYLCK